MTNEKRYYKLIEFGSVDNDKDCFERIIQDMLRYVEGRLINHLHVKTWSEDEEIVLQSSASRAIK